MKKARPEKEYLRAMYHGNILLWGTVIVLTMLMNIFNIFCSLLLGKVTDCMATGDKSGLITCALVTACAILAETLVIWTGKHMQACLRRRAMNQYKRLAFSKISEKGISAFARENTGRYLSALTNDTATIESQYLQSIPEMISAAVSFVVSIAIMLYYSPLLTLVMLLSCAIPIAVSLLLSGKYAALGKQVSDENEKYTSGIKDLLSGFSVIKSFKAEKEAQEIFRKTSSALEKKKERKERFYGLLSSMSTAAAMISQMGTFIVGAFLAIDGQISAGTVLMFTNLCNSVLNPIQTVPTYWAQIRSSKALVCKLAQITQENVSHGGKKIAPVLEQEIVFQDVSFGYEEDKPVLSHLDLTLQKGKKYAIVGTSGSGKSTLLNLLMGAYDGYHGSITVDGQEIRSIDPDSLYELMSLIGQNVFLFDSSIRENITMFRQFPDAQLDSVIKRSGLENVITAKGEAYRCGENGVGLSGGERQRISIARSLLRGTPILMLDEATAALDNQTAFEVTDAILQLEGLTRIVVTHRLEERLLQQYDAIIVMRDGHIAEMGTYAELMQKTGFFYSLYTLSNT